MLEKLLPSFKKWRESLDTLETKLDQKKQRLAYLEEAPLPANELAEAVVETMLKHGNIEFHRHLTEKLSHAVNNPLQDVASSEWRPGLVTKITQPQDVDPWCLVYLLRGPISDAIRTEIVGWKDMPKAGPGRADREVEVRQLQKDIESLSTKIEGERDEARRAGIELGQIHNRPSVRKRNKAPE